MKRTEIIATVGVCVTAAGLFLTLRAATLAGEERPTTAGTRMGVESATTVQEAYQAIEAIGLFAGLALLVWAAGRWLAPPTTAGAAHGPAVRH